MFLRDEPGDGVTTTDMETVGLTWKYMRLVSNGHGLEEMLWRATRNAMDLRGHITEIMPSHRPDDPLFATASSDIS